MQINEIEVLSSSLSVKFFNLKMPAEALFKDMQNVDKFDIEAEIPGIHDTDCSSSIVRGFYSAILPFEIEHLVNGITTKTLFKRIESCEFMATENMAFAFGNSGCIKLLCSALSAATGQHADPLEFEFNQLSQLQERMMSIKTIVVTNSKEKEIRRARLAGLMESYTDYNVIDPRNHGIDSVSGLLDTPLGPITITADRKGGVRFGVKKGMILTADCVEFVLKLITEEYKAPESAFKTF